MARILVDEKRWIVRGLIFCSSMLVAQAVIACMVHETIRTWVEISLVPDVAGFGFVVSLIYLAVRLKQRIRKIPEGL